MEIKKCKTKEGKSQCPLNGKCARADKTAKHYYGPINPKASSCVHYVSSTSKAKRR